MSYICHKPPGSCPSCGHYRFDEVYGGLACFAEVDGKAAKNEKGDSHAVQKDDHHYCG